MLKSLEYYLDGDDESVYDLRPDVVSSPLIGKTPKSTTYRWKTSGGDYIIRGNDLPNCIWVIEDEVVAIAYYTGHIYNNKKHRFNGPAYIRRFSDEVHVEYWINGNREPLDRYLEHSYDLGDVKIEDIEDGFAVSFKKGI